MRTGESHENIVELSGIREKKLRALSPYGPLKADSTTWRVREIHRENQEVRLMELLNSLENVVHDLNYKSFTVYDTLNTAIEAVRVALLASTIEEGGTDTL
jgi:hypothetical protein